MKLEIVKRVIEKVSELPTLPVIAMKVNSILSNPRSSSSELAAVIEHDQSLSANILKLVNSAFYSLPQRVTNITQAISLLGHKNISHIIFTFSVFDTLRNSFTGSFDRRKFWIHSIATAVMGVNLAEFSGYPFPEDSFTSGLLHDLGKVFMDAYLHQEFKTILEFAERENISFFQAENELYDINHAMVGEWIARTWRLPLLVVATIKHHHENLGNRKGFSVSSDLCIDIVRLADVAVRLKGLGGNGDGISFKPELTKDLFLRLPIREEEVLLLMEQIPEEMKKLEILLNLATEK